MENPCSAGTRIENYPARKAAALPALTQGLYALFFWYGMRYAYKHKTYDYRSFSNSLYGRTRLFMSNLYEICYLIMIGTASAAAFATGGSTIQTLSGLPTISQANGSFGSALWMAVLYFFFQLASISVMYQHMEPVTDVKQINRAAIGMFVCNFAAMELSIIGLLAIAYAADLATASVPMLVLIQNGVGAGVPTPIISILIILGSISTAVNMISGIVTRCVNAVERGRKSDAERMKGHLARNAVFTLIFTFIAFAIAQFGLMAVVKQGYAYLGYAALITLFIPFVLHALITRGREI